MLPSRSSIGAFQIARHVNITQHQTRATMADYSKISNKKITRIQSSIEIDDEPNFKPRLVNRNPRNLQQLSFDHKPQGFWLEKNPNIFWHKIVFEKKGKHLDVALINWTGKKLVEASTREKKLSKYFSNINTHSLELLGKILATRCLQCGYLDADVDSVNSDNVSAKAFHKALQESGLTLNESAAIVPRVVGDL